MYVMYSGYLASFVVSFILYFLWSLPDHPHPAMGAFAALFLLPALVVCISIEVVSFMPQKHKSLVADSISTGAISRDRAFFVGFTVGLCAICLVVLLGFWMGSSRVGFAAFCLIAFTIIAFSPAIGATWLLTMCQQRQRKKEVHPDKE